MKPSSSLSEIVDQIEPNESPGVGDPCTCCDESQLQYIDQLDCIRCDSDDMEHQEIQREIPFQDTLNKDTWGRSRNLVLIITVVVVLLALSAANEKS